ncbi:MAG: flagellar basal body-associated protein FliL [Hahellaceae bacterium]|nr:flagellar basal body-associated protein FliL [Hahellaceae bacterium]
MIHAFRQSALLILATLLVLSWTARAEEDAAASDAQVQYLDMYPSFVLNFSGGTGGKLRYLKADVSLRVDTKSGAASVEKHMPALRNEAVLLLSQQNDDTMMDNAKREALRLELLKKMQDLMTAEENAPILVDLLFTNFVVQR